MYQIVTLYDNSGLGNKFDCAFRSEKCFDKFLENFRYTNGFLNFNHDVWGEQKEKPNLMIISASNKETFAYILNFLCP